MAKGQKLIYDCAFEIIRVSLWALLIKKKKERKATDIVVNGSRVLATKTSCAQIYWGKKPLFLL